MNARNTASHKFSKHKKNVLQLQYSLKQCFVFYPLFLIFFTLRQFTCVQIHTHYRFWHFLYLPELGGDPQRSSRKALEIPFSFSADFNRTEAKHHYF